MNSNNAIGALHLFLNEVPTGEIQNSNEKLITVLKLLAEAWSSLEGGNDQNIDPTKIHRAESIRWTPPILSFVLERHGGTVNGSSRAALHQWKVNIEKGTANLEKGKYRQLRKTSPRMNTLLIAESLQI